MQILDILFPHRCINCGKAGKYFCKTCVSNIQLISDKEAICPVCELSAFGGAVHPGCRSRYSLDGLTSFFRYTGIIRKAVKAIKYRYIHDIADDFVSLINIELFLKSIILKHKKNYILAPIPLHPSRVRFRGFNQAEVLGRRVAKKLGILMRSDAIYRSRKTTPQVDVKDRQHRLKNMDKVFAVDHGAVKQYSSVFIFDDVFTTGATMRSAANALKRRGAEFVWGITMAR